MKVNTKEKIKTKTLATPTTIKVKNMKHSTPVTTTFPLVWKKSKLKVNMSVIDNPLDPKKLKPKIKTIEQQVQDLELEPAIMEQLNNLKAKKEKFDPAQIGKAETRSIGLTTFTDVAQRLYDIDHGVKILKNLDPHLLSPIMATQQSDGTLSGFDTMHGGSIVALLAKHGLWENCDPKNWKDFQYPFFVVQEPHPSFTPEAALHRNGKGQKKWKPYDFHRVHVSQVRIYKSTDKKYKDAEKRQALCEQYEAIPLPAGHPDLGKAGTQGHIEAIYNWKLDTLEFILQTHKKYWHGTKLDASAYGLYGNLYEHLNDLKIPVTGTDAELFLDHLNAIIKKFFTSLRNLRTVTKNAHASWYKTAYQRKSTIEVPHNAALAIVLKIYQQLGGTYQLPGDVVAFFYNNQDILDHIGKDILEEIENIKNPSLTKKSKKVKK